MNLLDPKYFVAGYDCAVPIGMIVTDDQWSSSDFYNQWYVSPFFCLNVKVRVNIGIGVGKGGCITRENLAEEFLIQILNVN